jgi:hypothetical protein
MKLLFLSIGVLAAFVAVWFFFVVPAERRHHERKLEMLRQRIEKRESAGQDESAAEDRETSGS